ncbi:MAG: transcription antitermination factor NusB [Rhodospirillales bacterium]|nr:transcription antitermination factor NusB [Rhodospirillales bacterium]MDH3791058.1 transcription antitermination factor NusB [Rhodospirillales bacterium]MDH3909859.1 transcription antitermination factor NusB [Rhodospirillales bacterium]MDH3919991.1 transcription antitermination factor NusB [Rhodospirillales bacterium]MDH3966222.1 transcription antitermination factor NusB [Rhodospirillales bacterium]
MSVGAKPGRAANGPNPRASARTLADTPRGAARLGAVQALYQIELSGGSPELILQEFLEHRLDEAIDGLSLGRADRALLGDLVEGVAAESASLDDMLAAVLAEDWPVERLETLLRVILRAGAYELGYRPEIPARATITEYVNLAQAFFDGKEPGMANGVLDHLAHSLRPEEFEDQDRKPDGPGGG